MNEEAKVRAIQQLEPKYQFAIVNCFGNLPYGANWGLCSREEIVDYLEDLKRDRNILVFPVSNGVVMQVADGFLETLCKGACHEVIERKDIETMQRLRNKARTDLQDFVIKKSKKGGYKGFIGIYCTNLTTNIRYNDCDFPAFRVDLPGLISTLSQVNGKIIINDRPVDAITVGQMLKSNPKDVFKSIIMSPTKTGAFIKIML